MTVEEILELMDELLDKSSSVPFSQKKMIDVEQMREYIDSIRLNLPGEIKRAKDRIRRNYTQSRHLLNDYLNYLDYNRYKYKKTEDGIRLVDSQFDYYVGITKNGETRYLSNIKDIENYDSEMDKIKAFKSSHKNYLPPLWR